MQDVNQVKTGGPAANGAATGGPAAASAEPGTARTRPAVPDVIPDAVRRPLDPFGPAERFSEDLIEQMMWGLGIHGEPNPATRQKRALAAASALEGIGPRNTMEGMIASMMVVSHDLALKLAARATTPGLPQAISESELRMAARFMNAWAKQADTLKRLRGACTTKVRIEHVRVGRKAKTTLRGEAERAR